MDDAGKVASKLSSQAITHTKMLLRMYRKQNPPQLAIIKKNPAMDPADRPEEASNSSRTLEVINEPVVAAFLRLLNPVLTGVTLAAVLGLAGTVASWQGNMQRLTFVVEQLSKDVQVNTNDNKEQATQIIDMRVQQKVMEQNINNLTWRVGRNERRLGGQ
jgi:hypothetical protein